MLSSDRADICMKYKYIESLFLDEEELCKCFESAYLDSIAAFTNGTFEEPGDTNTQSAYDYVKKFRELFESIKHDGLNHNCLIPVNESLIPLDGAHRIAIAAYLNLDIECVVITQEKINYDINYFNSKHISPETFELLLDAILEFDLSLRIAIIWPYYNKDINMVYKAFNNNLVVSKSLNLNANGVNNLCVLSYETENWIGNIQNTWKGSYSKSINCYHLGGMTECIIYKSIGEQQDIEIKERIRNLTDGSKHNIHSSDTHEETQKIFLTCFSKEADVLLNHLNLKTLTRYFNFKNLKLKSVNPFIFVGSSTLEILGIREARDIDIIVNKQHSSTVDSHNKYANFYPKPLATYLYLNLSVFNYMGIKFLPLSDLVQMKTKRAEHKDKLDILACSLLKPKTKRRYLYQRKIKLVLFVKRNLIKYKTLFSKKLKTILVFLGVFTLIKRIINSDK